MAEGPEILGCVKIRCPRCKSRNLTACEVTEALMLFDITDGAMTRVSYSEEFGGIVVVGLTCKICEHQWKPRGIGQISDLIKDDDHG